MTNPPIAERPATLTDTEALVEFNQRLAQETEDIRLNEATLRAGVEAILSDPSLGFYLVAVRDETPIGSLMITREWSDWRNGVFWWIQSVYVLLDYRRQGIYRRLYQEVQGLAKSHNVCGFRLYVERDNTVAQATYRNMGMTETPYKMFEHVEATPWPS